MKRRDMARPDWDADLFDTTLREKVQIVIGSLVVAMVVWGFLILLMAAEPA